MNLELINEINEGIDILDVNDIKFKEYGKVIKNFDCSSLVEYTEKNREIFRGGNEYIASLEDIETFEIIKKIRYDIYGQMEIQAGICTGQNSKFTGIEYHQGSETIISVTDLIIIVGRLQDLEENIYESKKAKAFYIKKGQIVEMYSTTLHYTPCSVCEDGFSNIVILLKGTNNILNRTTNQIITKKNKWFITHPSQKEKVKNGAYPGLAGEVLEIKIKKCNK